MALYVLIARKNWMATFYAQFLANQEDKQYACQFSLPIQILPQAYSLSVILF